MRSYVLRQETCTSRMTRSGRLRFVALAATVLSSPTVVHAASLGENMDAAVVTDTSMDQVQPGRIDRAFALLHDWNVVVGAAALMLPEYEGSDKFKVMPFPLVSASFGERVFLDPTGLRLDLYQDGGLRVGLKGGYDIGRQEGDSDYLKGLGDIDAGGILGGVVSYESGPFKVYAEVDKTIGGSDGLTGTLGAAASHRYEQFIFSADVSATMADDKYMAAYYGVNAIQSGRSGLAEYDAKGGLKRTDLKVSVTYMVNENWSVTGAAGAGLLMGDAKDSPIVKDDIQPFAMLGLAYRF
ncbi:MipA/OmpV family protein [Oryzibacter oryziterrae]|uniref:MipA/OmpV family protein n=1 Tax=Oryzibacter oryziterrae TaxID=2766474 RepID=UPI001F22916B|nr:MipA/OmpV family protein [Oryzibacter oryziterrae]